MNTHTKVVGQDSQKQKKKSTQNIGVALHSFGRAKIFS